MASKFVVAVAVLSLLEPASGLLKVAAPIVELAASSAGFGGNALMTSLAAFDAQGLDVNELEEMGNAIEKLVTRSHDEPTKVAVKSMSDFIMNTMVPNRERSQADDQAQLQSKVEAIQLCHLDYRSQDDSIFAGKVNAAKDHQVAYATYKITHEDCTDVLEGHALLKDAYCNAAQDSDQHLCKNNTEVLPKQKKCCDAQATLKLEQDKCNSVKNEVEFAKVQHKLIMDKVCSEYETCFSAKLRAYTDAEKLVHSHDKSRSWSTLLRVKCLVEDFKDRKVTKKSAKACEDKQYEFKKINYPEVPAKSRCLSDVQ